MKMLTKQEIVATVACMKAVRDEYVQNVSLVNGDYTCHIGKGVYAINLNSTMSRVKSVKYLWPISSGLMD